MSRIGILVAWLSVAAASVSSAGEIGYIEDFALAKDRSVPLKNLIPGTEDYYYYHCLHFQNTEQFDKVAQLLQSWIKRYKYTARVREMLNRQALLTYEKNPEKSLEYLRVQLGLRFNHQRETLNKNLQLPTRLTQNLFDREMLTKIALSRYTNLKGFENSALDWLVKTELNADRRRHLLQRLTRPDYPNLPKLVVDDLNYRNSKGFGSFAVHRQLLLSQLEESLRLKPNLRNQTAFVYTYLSKLHPNADVDWRNDPNAHKAYLDRLWKFVQTLDPVHNSLKAHVLYHRLVFDRSQGVYDKHRFMSYIKLPRNASYISSKYMQLPDSRRYRANLSTNYQPQTLMPIVGNDEPLVRSFLHHFFLKETGYKPYEPYIANVYLKHNLAETKIVNGLGDREQWYSMLPPAMYKQLQQRVDLDFSYTKKTHVAADEQVGLDLYVKNVKTLFVNIYEINTNNYYRENLRELDTGINLDGLVANVQRTVRYQEEPLLRVRRHFEFPSLKKPGTYVIDFIGNGKSSRVLVRKGRLRYLVRTTSAGHEFSVLDEQNRKLSDAKIWLAGHEYKAEKDGTINVPFSNRPGRQPIILSHGDLHTLEFFQHQAEAYSLSAGIYVDREALLKRKKAQLIVRPGLFLNGIPVTLSVLEDVQLVLTSVDHDGVTTTKEVDDFKLFEDRESIYEFQVPDRLASISFTLKAKVEILSQSKKIDLAVRESFSLNEIDRTDKIEDLHFLSIDGSYVLDLLGKTGEAKANRPVQFSIKHKDFTIPVNVTLQTDRQGRIVLGALADIASIRATGPEGTSHTFQPSRDRRTYHQLVHGKVGEPVTIPYMGRKNQPERSELSLLELRGNTFLVDRFEAISIKNGFLQLNGLPRGEYNLLLKQSGTRIRIRLTEGDQRLGYVLGEYRHLEQRGRNPLQIQSIDVGEEALAIRLQNVSKFTRVHVFATRYLPSHSVYSILSRVRDTEPLMMTIPQAVSAFVEGRNIGDEFRYIIDRKSAKRFPSIMLNRPSLLLNPWAIRKTQTSQQRAQAGTAFDKLGAAPASEASPAPAGSKKPARPRGGFANLDFLPYGTVALLNLVADDNGVISIKREQLGEHQHIHVVAADPRDIIYRSVSIPEGKREYEDIRFANGLDPKTHYTQQKQITVLLADEKFVLSDITTSKFEAYDSLARVHSLLVTLSGNPTLTEFGFILRWNKMKPQEKRDKYSKYACHELNFFLFKKDPQFFQQVMQPFLRNKRDQTFLDRLLTADDLTGYLQPWAYAQLNVVERILLAQRIEGELVYTSRHIDDLFELVPPNIDRFNHLYQTALKGTALDLSDKLGLGRAANEARALQRDNARYSFELFERPLKLGFRKSNATEDTLAPPGEPGLSRNRVLAAPSATAGKSLELESLLGEDASRQNLRLGLKGVGRAAIREELEEHAYFDRLSEGQGGVRQLYQKLDKTQEWVENNYYHLPIEQQNAALITVNSFWRDYANHDPATAFYSVDLADASHNFAEMMFVLSVLDLPFEAEEHESEFDDSKMTLTAGSPMIIFHKEIKPVNVVREKMPMLVSQNFYRNGDRYRRVNNEQVDKFITDEFLVQVVYGCQIVVTNPTSSRQKLDVLLQLPIGAIPVNNGQNTRSLHVDLQPYHTKTLDYTFYFPAAGKARHYPVHVSKNGELAGHVEPVVLNVVNEPTKIDRESWDFVSQQGSNADVIAYLNSHNLQQTKLDRIAFRMQDQNFFETVTRLLTQRHIYNHTLWSYAIKHDSVNPIAEYLQHADGFVARCGADIDSPLLTIDPVVRKMYQHMEYSPLVNARSHQLGRRRQILNDRFYAQYHRLLKSLSYRRDLSDDDLMAVTYYLILQDRIEESLAFFARINSQNLQTRLQYDYFTAYLDLFSEDRQLARKVSEKWLLAFKEPQKNGILFVAAGDIDPQAGAYPVERWRDAFAEVVQYLDEVEGKKSQAIDSDDRTKRQSQLAASEPNFDFQVEAKKIQINYRNFDEVQVNFYRMDIELLFSRNPFVQQYTGQFSNIRPNATRSVKLPKTKSTLTIPLPDEFHTSNVLVEIIGSGQRKSQAYYSHSLTVQTIENYGQLRVTEGKTSKPVSKAYVKVYAQMVDGKVKFYKDGYTDLRGRFDYTSLSTNELDFVKKFSLLVLSDQFGAVVQEAAPPKR